MAPQGKSSTVNAELVRDILLELMPAMTKTIISSLEPLLDKLTQLVDTLVAREQLPPLPAARVVEPDDYETEKCRRSVVVIGLPEADVAPQERNAVDTTSVRNILTELNVDSVPVNVFRMGAFDVEGKRRRPIKVEFCSMHGAVQVLRQSPALKSSPKYKSVYVRKSHPHALRVELMNKRNSDPNNTYVIYRDKVIIRDTNTGGTPSGDAVAERSVRRSDRPAAVTPEFAEY